jgi:hypothetical protein
LGFLGWQTLAPHTGLQPGLEGAIRSFSNAFSAGDLNLYALGKIDHAMVSAFISWRDEDMSNG